MTSTIIGEGGDIITTMTNIQFYALAPKLQCATFSGKNPAKIEFKNFSHS